MKLQSYAFSPTGNGNKIAEVIATEYRLKADKIPPAYQPEREAVVFISVDSGKADAKLLNFVKSLTPAKAKSVAFSVCGPDTAIAAELKAIVTAAGIKVYDNDYHAAMKFGMFGSKLKITNDQLKGVLEWAKAIIAEYEASL